MIASLSDSIRSACTVNQTLDSVQAGDQGLIPTGPIETKRNSAPAATGPPSSQQRRQSMYSVLPENKYRPLPKSIAHPRRVSFQAGTPLSSLSQPLEKQGQWIEPNVYFKRGNKLGKANARQSREPKKLSEPNCEISRKSVR